MQRDAATGPSALYIRGIGVRDPRVILKYVLLDPTLGVKREFTTPPPSIKHISLRACEDL